MRKLKIENLRSIIIAIIFFIAVYMFFINVGGGIPWGVEDLGNVAKLTMGNYVSIFILMSVLLLSSMVGAFYLASKEEKR